MRTSSVFSESFLEGFTMSGFLARMRQPGSATGLIAPEPGLKLTLSPASSRSDAFIVIGELGSVPRPALQAMMRLLKKEEERRADQDVSDKAMHGASR